MTHINSNVNVFVYEAEKCVWQRVCEGARSLDVLPSDIRDACCMIDASDGLRVSGLGMRMDSIIYGRSYYIHYGYLWASAYD